MARRTYWSIGGAGNSSKTVSASQVPVPLATPFLPLNSPAVELPAKARVTASLMRRPTASMLVDGSLLALLGAATPPLTLTPGKTAVPPSLGDGTGVPTGVGERDEPSENFARGRESDRDRFSSPLPLSAATEASAGEARGEGTAESSVDLRPRSAPLGGDRGGVRAPDPLSMTFPFGFGAGEADLERGLKEGSAKGARSCIVVNELRGSGWDEG